MKMKSFNDLVFKKYMYARGARQAIMFFPNGYGISVIGGGIFACSGDGIHFFEVAVLIGKIDNFTLAYDTYITDNTLRNAYDTYITDNTLRNVSVREISNIMKKIQGLKRKRND